MSAFTSEFARIIAGFTNARPAGGTPRDGRTRTKSRLISLSRSFSVFVSLSPSTRTFHLLSVGRKIANRCRANCAVTTLNESTACSECLASVSPSLELRAKRLDIVTVQFLCFLFLLLLFLPHLLDLRNTDETYELTRS